MHLIHAAKRYRPTPFISTSCPANHVRCGGTSSPGRLGIGPRDSRAVSQHRSAFILLKSLRPARMAKRIAPAKQLTRAQADAWRALHRQLARTKTRRDAQRVAKQVAPPHAKPFYVHLRYFLQTDKTPRGATRSERYVYRKLLVRYGTCPRDADSP